MRILFVGDVVGRSGRTASCSSGCRRCASAWRLDALVVNGENAAGGFGITAQFAGELLGAGVDVDHARQPCLGPKGSDRLHRPASRGSCARSTWHPGTPGAASARSAPAAAGALVVHAGDGPAVHEAADDPFRALEARAAALAPGGRGGRHPGRRPRRGDQREAGARPTSSTAASRWWPAPTPTCRPRTPLLPGGTGYITDVGMTGDYDSVIGMEKAPSRTLAQRHRRQRLEPARAGDPVRRLSRDRRAHGLARRIEPLRLGGDLRTGPPGRGRWARLARL